MLPPSWGRSRSHPELGASDAEHSDAYATAIRDGRRYLLRATAMARRGDCGQAIEALAIGANRIGSAVTHGTGVRPWDEAVKGPLSSQRSAIEDVARFCARPSKS